jgi:hypothetical protein
VNEVIQYLAMKTRYVFVENICQPIMDTQNIGPVEIIIGIPGKNQKVVNAVFIVGSICLDNEEAYKSQGKYFASGGSQNCRICDMQSKEFYKFSFLQEIANESPVMYNRRDINKKTILDEYNRRVQDGCSIRNTVEEMKMAAECESIWWKQKLFNKDNEETGAKRLNYTHEERDLLSEMKFRNLKPIDNNIIRGIIQPFLLGNGEFDEPILQPDLCFAIDKLHTAEKGFVSYSLEFGVTCFYLFQRKDSSSYNNNLAMFDIKMTNFDIYQPYTHWGSIPAKRIGGISGKLY